MKKERKILLAILVVALVVRIAFAFSTPLRIWDETVYAGLGYDLSRNPADYSFAHNGWSDFIPNGMWPKAGFRAPLLPYTLAVLNFLNLGALIELLMPVVGTINVLLVYFLGKKLFGEKTGLYSAVFISFLPFHAYHSGKILTDIFSTTFLTLAILLFWKGFEENDKRSKVLFGFAFALTILARYTMLWMVPVFLVYFMLKHRSLGFLKDNCLWAAAAVFLVTFIPLFSYGLYEYQNPLGAFVHGFLAAPYWGGTQEWYEYFKIWPIMFSAVGIAVIFALIGVFKERKYVKKEHYLLLLWAALFLLFAMNMPHKEDRYILPIAPAVCILTGAYIASLKKCRTAALATVVILSIITLAGGIVYTYNTSYTDKYMCFLEANKYLNAVENNALIITDESPVVYYYTKRETSFYPNPWGMPELRALANNYAGRPVYVFFTDFDMPLWDEKNKMKKADLDAGSNKTFECLRGESFSFVYKYA